MLLVESDYLVKGGLNKGTDGPAISREVDIRDPIDDAVDAVIQRLLEMGGRVVFLPPKSLQEHDRVVLLPNKESEG
jgi:hypothetical protein